MNLKRLAGQAKRIIDKRGGTESLKADADELRKIAKGEGSISDKAKAAAAALKNPGEADKPAAEGTGPATEGGPPPANPSPPPPA